MNFVRSIVSLLLLVALAPPAGAQLLEKKALSLEAAKKAAAAAVVEANRDKGGGVIAIVDDGGNLMYLERLDNTFAAGANISIGKARTAAIFKRPTSVFEEIIKKGRTPMVALSDFTPLQGGVPIEVDGQIVGAIGVSGAASAQRDEEVAIAGARALGGAPAMQMGDASPGGGGMGNSSPGGGLGNAGSGGTDSAVTYFSSDKVKAAFAKGTPLIEVEDYKVHASRREGAGMAEVHTRDTDIVYVLQGSATLVTGGTVEEGKTTAPEEIRGSSIQGGEIRELSPGDVIIIPRGVPHWFKEVKGPLTYYVVKVG